MDIQEIEGIFWTKFIQFDEYTPPERGTPERAIESKLIDKHLLNLQRHCRDGLKRDILRDIMNDLKFFARIREDREIITRQRKRKYVRPPDTHVKPQSFVIAYCIYSLLIGPKTKDYHRDLQVYAGCMFIAMKKKKLFKSCA